MNGMALFNSTVRGTRNKQFADAGLWALGGKIRDLAAPMSVWYNGNTYVVGYENNVTNNTVWIIKVTDGGTITSSQVNSGTTSSEPDNHPAPMLLIDDSGYIYVFQNKLHIQPFRYYKSDSTEDISSFTYQYDFTTAASYIGLLKRSGSDVKLLTRKGGASSYSNCVISLNLGTGTNSSVQFTDVDFAGTNVRHYPIMPIKYGTTLNYIGGIAHRYEIGPVTYKISLWNTQDFETFENIGQTFSKDVVGVAPITDAELESNFAAYGTDSAKSTKVGATSLIQIDDNAYLINYVSANTYRVSKYALGNATPSTYTLPVSIASTGTPFPYMVYNGTNLVLFLKLDDGIGRIYSMDLDLTNFTLKSIIDTPDADYFGLPTNLNEVTGNYAMIGRSTVGKNGTVPIAMTRYKFT